MTTKLNARTIVWALGVIQPASVAEVDAFLGTLLERAENRPTVSEIRAEVLRQVADHRAMAVCDKPVPMYALTYAGHLFLTRDLRKLRDQMRLFLLHKARRAKKIMSRGATDRGLAGAAPAVDTSTDTKGAAANKLVGRASLSGSL